MGVDGAALRGAQGGPRSVMVFLGFFFPKTHLELKDVLHTVELLHVSAIDQKASVSPIDVCKSRVSTQLTPH